MQVRIYHNSRCSKSRATLALLEERGLDPEVVNYLETPPSMEELEEILDGLGLEPRQLMRRNESEYKEHRLDDPGLSRHELVRALHDYPRLIERPIVVTDKGYRVGRPPESVLEIL